MSVGGGLLGTSVVCPHFVAVDGDSVMGEAGRRVRCLLVVGVSAFGGAVPSALAGVVGFGEISWLRGGSAFGEVHCAAGEVQGQAFVAVGQVDAE
ncbi:hypothetical protein SAMN05421874_101603 [Nonomuraea maritima]|uniref:Uncharacterized protein n=1 Tax=Nonomuraea maritima TaxID=683260 RepID=A0A1G8T783_9ACTN|nr:hypothetical protein SAMN05421874_101603 [Nonomuraea maritima]